MKNLRWYVAQMYDSLNSVMGILSPDQDGSKSSSLIQILEGAMAAL
jgi:hypothetical protein